MSGFPASGGTPGSTTENLLWNYVEGDCHIQSRSSSGDELGARWQISVIENLSVHRNCGTSRATRHLSNQGAYVVMVFAVLLFQLSPAIKAVPKAAVAAATSAQPAKDLPAAPVPNESAAAGSRLAHVDAPVLVAESSESAAQNSQALETLHVAQIPPAEPDKIIGVESAPSRKSWILLSIADHGAATFDAYSTRAAISRGAVEANPLARPFAGSDGLYAAIQVVPIALDFVARHMQRSHNGMLRRTWWLPQSASTGLFLFAGAHNMTVSGRYPSKLSN
jgi:hypothetical protein